MKRNKKQYKKADGILTGDFHLQEKQPVARTDDFDNTQWKKLDFISNLQKEHKCPVIHSGDLFDHWKPSPELLSKTIAHIPDAFHTIYGNHDLPQHNLELAYKCGINVLEKAGKLKVLFHRHWGMEAPKLILKSDLENKTNKRVLVWHTMTYQGKKPWPDCTDPKAVKLLRKHPEYDLILTGHNHKPFVEYYEGGCLVNPGSIFRLTADQKDFKPRVYLWYSDTNTVEPVYLPIENGVVSSKHLEAKKERNERIDSFVSTLDTDWKAKLSFEDNLERLKKKNNIKPAVMSIIYEALEG